MSLGGQLSATRMNRMHDMLEGYVARQELPGLVTLVSRRGETHVDVIGSLSFDGERPIKRDTLFRISSMTKPITTAATMILIEECKLRLEEPVDRLLPELSDRVVLKRIDSPLDDTVPAQRPITVRDLLTFTMGIGSIMAMPGTHPIQRAVDDAEIGEGPPAPSVPPEPDEWLRRLGRLPLVHNPGAKWMYNTSADVLGVLVARASGQPFERFLRERLFEPLGMTDTGFSVPSAKIDRLATEYRTNFQTGAVEVYDPGKGGQWSQPPAFPSGAGGLVSTVDDYLAFSQMLLNKGIGNGRRILSRPAVELMTSDQLTSAQKLGSGLLSGFFDSHGWGFGMSVVTRRDAIYDTLGRFGWDGGLGTSWYADPTEEMTTLLMTQQSWTSPSPPNVCRDFWTLTYCAIDD